MDSSNHSTSNKDNQSTPLSIRLALDQSKGGADSHDTQGDSSQNIEDI
jgi:hypothetical protein